MKKWHFVFHPVLIFVLAQLAWLSIVGIWIYWYVSNYIIFNKVGDKLSPQIVSKGTNVLALVMGLVLLAALLVGMYLIFIYLTRQLNLTRLYDNFIANITHELKSPLASIQLYLETLKLRNVALPKQKEFITLMIKDASRLNNLINSILEISGLEQKKIAHKFEIHSADSLMPELIEEAIEQFKISPQTIEVRGCVICRFVVDRDALRIVFNNIIDNAIKYSNGQVQLKINISAKENHLVVEFTDQGIGISAKNQKLIFKKFHRIYDPNSPNVKGTGLGLYWAKEIIKYHGGTISVYSEGRNQGSTFRIELPIYQSSKNRYINRLLKISTRLKQNQMMEDSIAA